MIDGITLYTNYLEKKRVMELEPQKDEKFIVCPGEIDPRKMKGTVTYMFRLAMIAFLWLVAKAFDYELHLDKLMVYVNSIILISVLIVTIPMIKEVFRVIKVHRMIARGEDVF